MKRRLTMSSVLAVAMTAALVTLAHPAGATPVATSPAPAPVTVPVCKTVAPNWRAGFAPMHPSIEGFSSTDSVLPGAPVDLDISTGQPRYRVEAYRMGNYGGRLPQACLVWQSTWQIGVQQPPAEIREPGTLNTVVAPWSKSLIVTTKNWQPGVYLLRLDNGPAEGRNFIPLIVRNASFSDRTVLVMPNTTWQAYNRWGGYSLYYGPGPSYDDRSRAVSFDRPYDWRNGPADFIQYELPFVSLAEHQGLPLAYATDIDLKTHPGALLSARTIVSVGHDEYYSPEMRQTLQTARDRGINLGFMGANDIYRKIRSGSPSQGGDRLVINYKDLTDPIANPALKTTQWNAGPAARDESTLLGGTYRCSTKVNFASMVVTDPKNWLFAGTGATSGLKLPSVVGQEYDGVNPSLSPDNVEVLFHSPVTCGARQVFQDTTYYTTTSHAGVFYAGAYFWACAIGRSCDVHIAPATAAIVSRITTNFLAAASAGPLGRTHPSVGNASAYLKKGATKK